MRMIKIKEDKDDKEEGFLRMRTIRQKDDKGWGWKNENF